MSPMICPKHGDLYENMQLGLTEEIRQCRECSKLAITNWQVLTQARTGVVQNIPWEDRIPLWACVAPIVVIVLSVVIFAIYTVNVG